MKTIRLSIAATIVLATVATAQSQRPRYTVKDLGTLPHGTFSAGFDMNDAGWVGGASNLEPGGLAQHAVIWRGRQIIDLGTLGGPNSAAGGPNTSLQAVVVSDTALADPNGEDFCFWGTHLQCLAGVWRNGRLSPLQGGNNSSAFSINNRGQVVGLAETDTFDQTCITPFQVRRFQGVIWQPEGSLSKLPPLAGDTVSFAFGINEKGQAVGASGLCSDTVIPPYPQITAPHAVLWELDGSATLLGNNLGGTRAIASDINSRGDVAGAAQVGVDGPVHAFLWTKQSGMMRDLGVLQGDVVSVAPCCNTMNENRQVVGFSCPPDPTATCRAFLWQDDRIHDLNDLIPADSTLSLMFAQSINSRGQITGIGIQKSFPFEVHAFLATPAGEGERSAAQPENGPNALPEGTARLLRRARVVPGK